MPFILFLLLSGPSPADAVRAREIAFAQSMADRDLEAFAGFVSEEALFFGDDEILRGREAVVAGWSRFFEGEQAPFSWTPERVEVLDSGGLAHSSGSVVGPNHESYGQFNSIWRLEEDGQWRVVFDKGCD